MSDSFPYVTYPPYSNFTQSEPTLFLGEGAEVYSFTNDTQVIDVKSTCSLTINKTPTLPKDAVNKEYVDRKVIIRTFEKIELNSITINNGATPIPRMLYLDYIDENTNNGWYYSQTNKGQIKWSIYIKDKLGNSSVPFNAIGQIFFTLTITRYTPHYLMPLIYINLTNATNPNATNPNAIGACVFSLNTTTFNMVAPGAYTCVIRIGDLFVPETDMTMSDYDTTKYKILYYTYNQPLSYFNGPYSLNNPFTNFTNNYNNNNYYNINYISLVSPIYKTINDNTLICIRNDDTMQSSTGISTGFSNVSMLSNNSPNTYDIINIKAINVYRDGALHFELWVLIKGSFDYTLQCLIYDISSLGTINFSKTTLGTNLNISGEYGFNTVATNNYAGDKDATTQVILLGGSSSNPSVTLLSYSLDGNIFFTIANGTLFNGATTISCIEYNEAGEFFVVSISSPLNNNYDFYKAPYITLLKYTPSSNVVPPFECAQAINSSSTNSSQSITWSTMNTTTDLFTQDSPGVTHLDGVKDLCFSPSFNTCVAIGETTLNTTVNTHTQIMYSQNSLTTGNNCGLVWSSYDVRLFDKVNCVACNSQIYVVGGDSSTYKNSLAWSNDSGKTWNGISINSNANPFSNVRSIRWTGLYWLACGIAKNTSNNIVAYAYTPDNWITISSLTNNTSLWNKVYSLNDYCPQFCIKELGTEMHSTDENINSGIKTYYFDDDVVENTYQNMVLKGIVHNLYKQDLPAFKDITDLSVGTSDSNLYP
jgi:hypothetical protein